MNDTQRVNQIRHELIEIVERHEQECPEEGCVFKGNLLAFLGHCIGASDKDVRDFERLLVHYELECQKYGGCEAHPNARRFPRYQQVTWSCHVCGQVRRDAEIAVATHDISALWDLPPGTIERNVRYCAADEECQRVAHDPEFARRPFEDGVERSQP